MKTLIPYKTTLDGGNAYWMARLAQLVYCRRPADPRPDEAPILTALQQQDPQFTQVIGYSEQSAQAMLVVHGDYLAVAFRGTDEPNDWLDNLNAFATDQLFGEFHRGFYQSFAALWPQIEADINRQQQQQSRPLFFCGHSLGGAMATIAAAQLVHQDKPFTSLYTFGQPRAMTRATARIFNQEAKGRYFRFHNNNDLVTRVPARFMGYSHAGTYLYISEEKQIHQEPGFWFRFLDSVDGAVNSVLDLGLDAIDDHGMEHYLAAIEQWQFEP
ncbi:lipase family protein [uncultured Ferrimonas sp.]|uniref:lipase family protein n=1 Tax=uncultured Ferrimonas sp. TaxID=432640 RepID=UPI00262F545D|nr:lipase family protein [uncultured Ferrimonas sp.]